MRFLSVALVSVFFVLMNGWGTDFEDAKKKAEKEHKLILLNFSGSDWCVPCIKFKKQVFENTSFQNFADSNLVLVNADFPRLNKNQLSKTQQKKNDKLADKYNPDGIFPYTLLLNSDGKMIKSWQGFPNLTAEQFTGQIKDIVDAGK
ncbi:MAG: thioredoxin family protein [Chitinophagaceae bacterium]